MRLLLLFSLVILPGVCHSQDILQDRENRLAQELDVIKADQDSEAKSIFLYDNQETEDDLKDDREKDDDQDI